MGSMAGSEGSVAAAAGMAPASIWPMLKRHWPLFYALAFAAIGLLHSLSAWQAYRRGGGRLHWEPFLWEFSSVFVVALLALPLYLAVQRIEAWRWPQQLLAHATGFLLFTMLHVAGMYGIRFAVYAATGLPYLPGRWHEVLLFEAGKDAVSYLTLTLLMHGLQVWRAARARREALERLQRELSEAQAARLADQVQPHFLFNTLNLIASTVHEDANKADALICDLAALLRQTTQAQTRVEHSLADELQLVQPFMRLMQARFGSERLQLHLDASPEALAASLPALLLLVPVENAIKHDVARHQGPVRVRLSAQCQAGRLHIQLDNNGVAEPGPSGDGSGLRNLRERLRARHGEAARVELQPFGGGMRLSLEMPA